MNKNINTIFRVGKEFEKHIENIGFKKILTQTASTYYVNDKGNQIKIDKTEIITILDNKGFTLVVSDKISANELLALCE